MNSKEILAAAAVAYLLLKKETPRNTPSMGLALKREQSPPTDTPSQTRWNRLLEGGIALWGLYELSKLLPPNMLPSMESRSIGQITPGQASAFPVPEEPRTFSRTMERDPGLLTLSDELQKRIDELIKRPLTSPREGTGTVCPSPAFPQSQLPVDHRLAQIIPHPSIVLILGKRGSGKTAEGYRILELCRYRAQPYVVGLPKQARKLLPDWIGFAADLEDIPHDAIALVDEAYLSITPGAAPALEARRCPR